MDFKRHLLPIIAHARSGALEKAWAMFHEAGLDRVTNDPAVLSVKGRLLKDQAVAAKGASRRRFYRVSAQAYTRSAKISGAAYPLINAATLSLLAGDHAQSRKLARDVLKHSGQEPETPYWRAATRAEAQLLLGDVAQARVALKKAMSRAPRAYEDHASTLRQFGLILEELHEDKNWLDSLRPPKSLHFMGHMALAPGNKAVLLQARALIEQEHVGFGYGALAAGADILIAQALLEAGAELHVVLPGTVKSFRAESVARFGQAWTGRFDDLLRDARSIRTVEDTNSSSSLAVQLAAELAMGCAAIQADSLMTEAVQLAVLERESKTSSGEGVSGKIGATWRHSGRHQHVLLAPRIRTHAPKSSPHGSGRLDRVAAVLRIEIDNNASGAPQEALNSIARLLKTKDLASSARWTGEAVIAEFGDTASAARAAIAAAKGLRKHGPFRIAGDYAIGGSIADPFAGAAIFDGPAPAIAREIALSTPNGAIHVSERFAAALCISTGNARPRVEYVGELPAKADRNTHKLFSLTQ